MYVSTCRGKSGPLFHFDVHEDVRTINDARIEKDESHAGKIVERHWCVCACVCFFFVSGCVRVSERERCSLVCTLVCVNVCVCMCLCVYLDRCVCL
jgi:hypothetical protein